MRDGVNVLGVWVDNITKNEVVEKIIAIIGMADKKPKLIGSAQIHKINIAYQDYDVTKYLNECKLCYCDGGGVKWASILLGKPLKDRMTAPDFILDVFRECAKKGYGIYVLGGRPGVLERAFESILKNVPDLPLLGLHHGYFDLVKDNDRIISKINDAMPDILIVGMGIPRQEKWVLENREKLKAGTIWALGATFDYFAGVQSRGPSFLRRMGHEWLGRLINDPRRLAKRYLVGNVVFFCRVMSQRFSQMK